MRQNCDRLPSRSKRRPIRSVTNRHVIPTITHTLLCGPSRQLPARLAHVSCYEVPLQSAVIRSPDMIATVFGPHAMVGSAFAKFAVKRMTGMIYDMCKCV